MVAGNSEIISQILKVKSQMDSGMFKPLQLAAIEAMKQGPEWFARLNEEYERRRVLAGEIFDLLGAEYDRNSSGMFLWGKVSTPASLGLNDKTAGEEISDRILHEAGVFITPGFIFGRNGENYVRISLCAKPEVLQEAKSRVMRAMQVVGNE